MATKKATSPRKTSAAATRDGDTEQRILDAAHHVFVRTGTAGARMQDIARQAGVNQALLHYYFRSKQRLAEAIFRRAAAGLLPAVLRILSDPAMPIAEKVERVVHHEIDTLAGAPYLPAYVLSELTQHPERVQQLVESLTGLRPDRANPAFDVLGKQLRAGARAGDIRPITPEEFTINLLSLCIFPFAARPMLRIVAQLGDEEWTAFIARRRRELPRFFLDALRP